MAVSEKRAHDATGAAQPPSPAPGEQRARRFDLGVGATEIPPAAPEPGVEPAQVVDDSVPDGATPSVGLVRRRWFRIAVSVVGTLVLARYVGVLFPDVLVTALLAAVGALLVGRWSFRRLAPVGARQSVIAVSIAGLVSVVAFVLLFFVFLYVWMILWLNEYSDEMETLSSALG